MPTVGMRRLRSQSDDAEGANRDAQTQERRRRRNRSPMTPRDGPTTTNTSSTYLPQPPQLARPMQATTDEPRRNPVRSVRAYDTNDNNLFHMGTGGRGSARTRQYMRGAQMPLSEYPGEPIRGTVLPLVGMRRRRSQLDDIEGDNLDLQRQIRRRRGRRPSRGMTRPRSTLDDIVGADRDRLTRGRRRTSIHGRAYDSNDNYRFHIGADRDRLTYTRTQADV
jgi:hypothetical protein